MYPKRQTRVARGKIRFHSGKSLGNRGGIGDSRGNVKMVREVVRMGRREQAEAAGEVDPVTGHRKGRAPEASIVVAAIVKEPEAIIRRFVDWYRQLGASRIRLYFDDPNDPVIAAMADDPLVDAVPCTPEFWQSIDMPPEERFTLRQNAALTHAYQTMAEDWLLVVDADELLHVSRGFLPRRLARAPEDMASIIVAPAEHVHSDQDATVTTFRLPITRRAVNDIYQTQSDLFRRRFGLIGHSNGKSLHRSGIEGLRIRQHWAVLPDGTQLPAHQVDASKGMYLLHYVAADYPAWRAKLDWRLESSGFNYESKDLLDKFLAEETDPEAAYRRFYDVLHVVDAERKEQLRAVGGILELPADLAAPPK